MYLSYYTLYYIYPGLKAKLSVIFVVSHTKYKREMLNGEGNENGKIGLILYVQHTFLYISLALFCATTM